MQKNSNKLVMTKDEQASKNVTRRPQKYNTGSYIGFFLINIYIYSICLFQLLYK